MNASKPASSDPLDLLRAAPPPPAETPQKTIMQLAAVAVVLGVVLAGYAWHMKSTYAVKTLVAEALPLLERADVMSLRQAQAKYDEALERGGNDLAYTGAAETYAMLWVEHGFADAKDKAIQYTQDSVQRGIENSQRYLAEALVAIGDGRPADGKRVIDNVLVRGGSSERVFFALGRAELALGNAKAARDRFKRAHDMKNQQPHFARWLGDASDDMNDPKTASFAWESASKSNPTYVPGVARDLIARLRRGEDRKLVAAELAKLTALAPENVGPQGQAAIGYVQALIAYQEGKLPEALKALEGAIAAGGETPRMVALRGATLLASGKKEGINDVVKAQALAPNADRYLLGLADTYIDQGRAEDAVKTLMSAGEKRGDEPAFQIALGYAYVAKADYAKAKAAFDKALSVEAENADAMLGHAVLGWKQRKFDDALPFFEKAIVAKPKFPELYESIGLMYADQGDVNRANSQIDMAEKLFRANEVDTERMLRFYRTVIKGYGSAKGGSNLAKEWGTRELAYRNGTQPALE